MKPVQTVDAVVSGGAVTVDLALDGGLIARMAVEVGGLTTFFSSEDEHVGRATRRSLTWDFSDGDRAWRLSARVAFEGADLQVREEGFLRGDMGTRSLSVVAEEDSLLMDAVLRFVLPLPLINEVQLGSKQITHRARNRYHQVPLSPVRIRTFQGRTLQLTPRCSAAPAGMTPLVYVRDERGRWVVHVRLLATAASTVVLKGCHRLYDRPFPAIVQRLAARFPSVAARALYLRERVSQRIPFQANGAVLLPRSASLELSVDWEWS